MMDLFNSSILKSNNVLNEADYSMGGNFDSAPLSEYDENAPSGDQQQNDQNTTTTDGNNQEQQPAQTNTQADQSQPEQGQNQEPQQDQNQQSEEGPEEETSDEEEDTYVDDESLGVEDDNERDPVPTLDILNNLSEEEYRMNNLNCYRDFEELYNKVNDSLDNSFKNIITKNKLQRIVLKKVRNNLNDMLKDIDNYISFRFNRSYENNIVAYMAFIKRYNTAIEIAKKIVQDNLDNKEEKK